jgi:hypothetical protein
MIFNDHFINLIFLNRGNDFYADTSTLTYGTHKPTPDAMSKMVTDLDKQ